MKRTISPSSPRGLLETAYRSNYPNDDPSPEEQLAAIRRLREDLIDREDEITFDLRLGGATWEHIAQAVGLGSKQAAQQRFKAAGLLDKLKDASGRGQVVKGAAKQL